MGVLLFFLLADTSSFVYSASLILHKYFTITVLDYGGLKVKQADSHTHGFIANMSLIKDST